MKKIRIGFIGVGFISQTCHLPCFYHNKHTDIVAISDKNQELNCQGNVKGGCHLLVDCTDRRKTQLETGERRVSARSLAFVT